MMLSQLYPNLSCQEAQIILNEHLLQLATNLNALGWPIVASFFKRPNLHPYKALTKEQLFMMASYNLKIGRANAINLRLCDSSVIALDCDFYSEALMSDFLSSLCALTNLKLKELFTCFGLKGGKIFFKYVPPAFANAHLNAKLGAQYLIDNKKHELEIKTLVSTVAGLHSPIYQDNKLCDFVVYTARPNTSFIGHTNANSLPTITKAELNFIAQTYTNLALSYGPLNSKSEAINTNSYLDLIFSGICFFAQQALFDSPVNSLASLQASSLVREQLEPLYLATGLKDALLCVDSLFYGRALYKRNLAPLCGRFKNGFIKQDAKLSLLENKANRAGQVINMAHSIKSKKGF